MLPNPLPTIGPKFRDDGRDIPRLGRADGRKNRHGPAAPRDRDRLSLLHSTQQTRQVRLPTSRRLPAAVGGFMIGLGWVKRGLVGFAKRGDDGQDDGLPGA